METDVFEEQMVIALGKVRHAMEEAGSSMNNIIKTLMLLKNLDDYPRMRKTELEYYQKYAPFLVESPPASTFMQVNLAKPGFLVEIDVMALFRENKFTCTHRRWGIYTRNSDGVRYQLKEKEINGKCLHFNN